MGDAWPSPGTRILPDARPTLMGEIARAAAEFGWRRIPTPGWRPAWRREWTDPAGVEWTQQLEVRPERDRPDRPARLTAARWHDTEDPAYDMQWDLPTPLAVYDAAVDILRAQP